MKFLTWDIGFVVALVLLVSFSLLIQRQKALAALVGVYIASVVTSLWGDPLKQVLTGEKVIIGQWWVHFNVQSAGVNSALLVLLALLLTFSLKIGGKRRHLSVAEVIVYSLCAVMLAVVFMLAYLSDDARSLVLSKSHLVPYIYSWRQYIVLLPVGLIFLFGLMGSEE